MTFATGIGSLPGSSSADYDEAVRALLGELGAPNMPFVPEMPGRSVHAGMTGRGLAHLVGLAVDLQPAGWRLTGTSATSGIDHRRAVSLLAQDLDCFEEHALGLGGALKTQVVGPWTLAATVERPRGDKVLADHGARRDLAESLAEGVANHVADLRRRVRGAERIIVQVDEPALAAVANAQVPTASGWGKHRAVHPPELSALLATVLEAITAAGAEPWVHACAPGVDWNLVTGAGAAGIAVDLDVLGPEDLDAIAETLEAGRGVMLGAAPALDPQAVPGDKQVTERVLRLLDMLGLDPERTSGHLGVTHGCGQAGATSAWVRQSWALLGRVARNL